MEIDFICIDCGDAHREPAEAQLGHRIVCLECAMQAAHHAAEPALAADVRMAA